MSVVRRLLCACAVAALIAVVPAKATDLTDLWWNSSESGWGMNIAHQSNTIFLTFFVYGADGKAGWYSATATYSGQNAGGSLLYTGDLYEATGPYYGGVFSPSSVHPTKVGNATFQADTVDTEPEPTRRPLQCNRPARRQRYSPSTSLGKRAPITRLMTKRGEWAGSATGPSHV